MLINWALRPRIVCASCRLRALLIAKRSARSGRPVLQVTQKPWRRTFASIPLLRQDKQQGTRALEDQAPDSETQRSPEQAALAARKTFGDALPEGELNQEEYRVYERLYGRPTRIVESVENETEGQYDRNEGTGILRENEDGTLEEVEFEGEESDEELEMVSEYLTEGDLSNKAVRSLGDARLAEDMRKTGVQAADGEMLQEEEEEMGLPDEHSGQRSHPLTRANKFCTSPSTIQLPQASLVEPVSRLLSGKSNAHIVETAQRVFGGARLPYSTSTPAFAETMQPKPVGLDAFQGIMGEMEGDVFMAAMVPGIYASIMSVLVETRKRLGTSWAAQLVQKAQRGDLRILDAGGGGAGVLAVRDLLAAEWERMHEDSISSASIRDLARADGKLGGAGESPPLGSATVLTGSGALRRRASELLENTTFVPRLPNYLQTTEQKARGKFDIVIAPHTLWQLREDHVRKSHVQNLWSMLSTEGGVLVLLEKGVPRGFELVAGARETLLNTRIAGSQIQSRFGVPEEVEVQWEDEEGTTTVPLGVIEKEQGTIIAPCTNHAECPMFKPKISVRGRRDICSFSQRYIRPPFLQSLLQAKGKNFEDVNFSYVSLMRGRDVITERNIKQDPAAHQLAFQGHEDSTDVESLALPRLVRTPIKRKGHVILDLCTPIGTFERWTVPRSFSKIAFRDARKSSLGDLWALGAKTSIPRAVKINSKHNRERQAKVAAPHVKDGVGNEDTLDSSDMSADGDDTSMADAFNVGGKLRPQRKIGGIRDKRDKKGTGNGRRKHRRDTE